MLGFIRIRCLLVQLCLKRSSDFVLAAGCGSVFTLFCLSGIDDSSFQTLFLVAYNLQQSGRGQASHSGLRALHI